MNRTCFYCRQKKRIQRKWKLVNPICGTCYSRMRYWNNEKYRKEQNKRGRDWYQNNKK